MTLAPLTGERLPCCGWPTSDQFPRNYSYSMNSLVMSPSDPVRGGTGKPYQLGITVGSVKAAAEKIIWYEELAPNDFRRYQPRMQGDNRAKNERIVERIKQVAAEKNVTPAQLDIFSEEPVEYPRGVLDRPSRMSLASVLGAIAFGSLATACRSRRGS